MSTRGQEGLAYLVQHSSVKALRDSLPQAAGRWLNADQHTLLFIAVILREKDCKEVCELLLDVHNIDPNAEDKRGQTALHYLAKTKHLACVDLLVSRGCKVDHIDKYLHQTPLFYAARYSTRDMVKRLVDHKAEVNFKDVRGQTPMFYSESLEVCAELLRGRGDACLAVDSANLAVAEWQRQRPHPRHELSDFLAACAEVRGQPHRCRLTWAVQRVESPGVAAGAGAGAHSAPGAQPLYGNWSAYATSMARGRDVDQLCELENEFVEDHRQMLGSRLPEAELWNQVGLNPDAAQRRNTIRSITQVTPKTPKVGKVKHYTVKCVHMPPNPHRQTGAGRTETHRVVGYVYFRICDGDREDGAGARGGRASAAAAAASSAARAAPSAAAGRAGPSGANDAAKAKDARGPRGHIVVSHLKVNAEHQRRGVATLLLAGMLQLVETEHKGFNISHLYLSVVARNSSAAALYRKLGFVQTSKDGETVEWLHMKKVLTDGHELSARPPVDPTSEAQGEQAVAPAAAAARGPEAALGPAKTSSETRDEWLRRVRGTVGSLAHDGVQPKRRQLDLMAAEILPPDSSRPTKRRLEMKTTTTPITPGATSEVSTATSTPPLQSAGVARRGRHAKLDY